MSPRRIRDLVDVRARPAVVRLEHLEQDEPDWISETYFQTAEVADHLGVLRRLLAQDRGCGVFLVGHYGCGKSHLLAYLAQQVRGGRFVDREMTPVVATVSLVNFRAEITLETIVAQTLDLDQEADDRRQAWRSVGRGAGLVLIIDELSEFLRSKSDRSAFTEDVRFLQFMGEWASSRRLWVVAAMQEQIEHTGALESALYRKIKDRYPVRLLLTPGHVRDLLAHSLLARLPGYEEAVDQLAREVRTALPDADRIAGDLAELYPLHPATLDLLEEVRDLFSQSRGVVDFVLTRLAGHSARAVPAFLDRPWGELLTPEHIVDHFADLFELQPEFLPLAQRLLPYYRRNLDQLFSSEAQRTLAWRLLKLLILVHISPRRERLRPAEAALWLLFRATSIDPDRNRQIVARVLSTLASDGRYVSERRGAYALDLRDDSADRLDEALRREVAELAGATEEAVWEGLLPLLGESAFNPFSLPRDRWQQRTVRWHFHDRPYAVFFGNGSPREAPALGLCIRLPWGDPEPAPGVVTVTPAALELRPELLELAALLRLGKRQADARLRQLVDRRVGERSGLFVTMVHNAFLEARATIDGKSTPAVRPDGTAPARHWLDACAIWVLRRTFPSFERFAPAHGPLPKEAARSLMRVAAEHNIGDHEGDELVKLIREAYLVPMGLLTREGWYYTTNPKLERNELVRLVLPLAENQAPVDVVYQHLAQPVYGLVEDQVHLLLLFLLLEGQIDIVKGGRSHRDLFETMPWPRQYDRITAGRSLGVEQLKALDQVCSGLRVRPSGQWTAETQRRVARQLRTRSERERKRLFPLLERVRQLDRGSELAESLERLIACWSALDKGDNELQAVEHFLFAIGSPGTFLAEVAALADLPQRLEVIIGHLRRYRHLLAHPQVQAWPDASVSTRLEAVGEPPDLGDVVGCEQWLEQARAAYDAYRVDYRRRHDEWWQRFQDDAPPDWNPPQLATSRHVGLGAELEEHGRCRSKLQALVCRGVCDLEFQPLCTCGFDGATAPALELAERLASLRLRIEDRLRLFFQQDQVRDSIRRWNEQGLEVTQGTLRYLEGQAEVPEISDTRLLDQHLAGIDLVHEVAGCELLQVISGRSLTGDELMAELARFVGRFAGKRIRVAATGPDPDGRDALVRWCVERALADGVALPAGLGRDELDDVAEALSSEWVSTAALDRLEDLGLGRRAEDRILTWLYEGVLDPPGAAGSQLVQAVNEVHKRMQPTTPETLAALMARLYRAHPRLRRIAGNRWLERLDVLARSPIEPQPADLVEVLRGHGQWQWLMVDCLGLGLLLEGIGAIGKLTGWRLQQTLFARVGETTTTDACFRMLADEGVNHSLTKIDAVDRLLHGRRVDYADLCRLARAELEVALGEVVPRLDGGHEVLVFADHGFRLAADGHGFEHGGPSILERVVPVFELAPAP